MQGPTPPGVVGLRPRRAAERDIDPNHGNFDIPIAGTNRVDETLHVETPPVNETLLPVYSAAGLKAQRTPGEPTDLRGQTLRVRPPAEKLPATENAQVQAASRQPGRSSRRGSIGTEQDKGGRATQHTTPRAEEHETEPDRRAGTEEADHDGRIWTRRTRTPPEARVRDSMRAGKTQLRGTSPERHTANRRRGWIGKLRSKTTQQAERTAGLITTITAIVALTVLAPPAAADQLTSNFSETNSTPTDAMKLSVNQFAQSFTTGSNATGYQLESISLDFATGRAYEHDPVYVSVWPDNGSNRPASSGQIAFLGKNYYSPGPVAGVNKYRVLSRSMGGARLSSVHLASNTRYWVYIWAGEQATTAQLHTTAASREDRKPGWRIGDARLVAPEGGTAADYVAFPNPLKIKVEGRNEGLSQLAVRTGITVTEGVDDTADFGVGLSPASAITVTVDYTTENQTAFAPADFEATSGTLTFQPGETFKTVSVPIVDDTDFTESDEEFNLKLSNASGASIAVSTGVATIVNNAQAKVSINDVTVTEGVDATADFKITLNGPSGVEVRVTAFSQSDTATRGDDFTSSAQTFVFAPGETEKIYSVTIIDDTLDDSGETFNVRLIQLSGATFADGGDLGVGTILNTETLTASFENVPQNHDGSNAFTFNVAFTSDVAIGYADMRDHAFTVTEGDVTQARRVDGRSDRWEITVDPDGDDDVTITLRGHRACGTTGAICSKEDNPGQLSNSPGATIAGPTEETVVTSTPSVSIAGGSGTEGTDSSISFTVTLDEAATDTVTVDYATSDGTAESGDDYTAKSGTLSFSAGTTSKTLSVSISDDSNNESDETFTVTLSNASGADLGTATATGTIENRNITPVTATFSGMPDEHDGSSEFTFELGFSQNVKLSYRDLRDDGFSVSGGDVRKAQRKTQGSNQNWTITVEPDNNGDVTIRLPETTDCDDDGAVCTADGGKLNHSTTDTVLGPTGISVGDVEVAEGADAVLVFAVSLTRAAGSALTVDYATSDGTATAGADYNAASGTLTIGAGSSSGSIEVSVIDDEHNEGSETFTLTLWNPSSGNLTDSSATGTITNHDALPAALVARFGRTAALHVVEQVEERVNAPRAPGFDGRVAGRQVSRNMGRDLAGDLVQQLAGGYRGAPAPAGVPSANGGMTSSLGPQRPLGPQGRMAHGAGMQGAGLDSAGMQGAGMQHDAGFGLGLGGREQLLGGSGFALNRATSSGGVLSFWSRSASSSFYGQDGALALNGDVRSTMFGADYSKGRMITGVSLAHTRGLGGYAGAADTGRMTSAVTGLYPWVGFKASERVTVWTVAGYGAGGLLLDPGAGAPIETGLSMAMAAGGSRGELMTSDAGFELAFKADALWVGTRTDAASGASGNLKATQAGVTRLRTALEGSKSTTIAARMAFTPSVEIGIRQDGGDAEVGRGVDVGLGLMLADGVTGLAVDVRIRRLLVHQADGFAESGMSISVSYDPSPKTPLGFTARVSPAWGGDAMSGADALWGRETMSGMGREHLLGGGSDRLDTEVGYGLPIGARFVGTPRVGLRTSEYGRDYRVGYGMQVLEQGRVHLQLGVDAERRESPVFHLQKESRGTDQRVLGRATVQW